MRATRYSVSILSFLLLPVSASGADFALSIDAPESVATSSEFDVVLRGTSVDKGLLAYSALVDYDLTDLTLLAEETGFAGTVWENADFRSVTEEPGGRIRVAAVMDLPSAPGGPTLVPPGQSLSFLKLRFRAGPVPGSVSIGFAGTIDDNLLADEDLQGHDTGNDLELTPGSVSVLELTREIDVSPLSLDFGQVFLGSSSTLEVLVQSTGLSGLEIINVGLGSGTSSDFQIQGVPSLPTELPSGGDFVLQVTYTPSSIGSDSGSLLIESDDPDEASLNVALAGSGTEIPVAEIDVTPLQIDFGEILVGAPADATFRIASQGTVPLEITTLQLNPSASSDFSLSLVPALPALVAPGGDLVLRVTYDPTASGLDSGLVLIESNDVDEPNVAVSLTGRGLSREIEVSPASLNFGALVIGTSKDETLEISNPGTAPLHVATIELDASSSSDFTLGSLPALPATVAPGGELTLQVSYEPSGVGSDSGMVRIESDDPDASSLSVPLSGEGTEVAAPEIEASPLSIDFGNVDIGSSTDVALRVVNRGTLTLTITDFRLESDSSVDFSLSAIPAIPFLVAPGGELLVQVIYNPLELGSDLGSVSITSDDADEGALLVPLSGFGLPAQTEGVVAHLPLDCSAEDIISGETGRAVGSVRCNRDRFFKVNGAVEFGFGGFVTGDTFPVVAGDFILEAWILPELGAAESRADVFVIHNEENPAEVPALSVGWDEDTGSVLIERKLGESIEVAGLAASWHHLLLARSGEELSLYVDGRLEGSMTDTDFLGGAYTLGAAPRSPALFNGRLDALILESGTLSSDDEALTRTLLGGPSVYVHPSDRVRTISANPGFSVEALEARLTRADSESGDLEIVRFDLAASDVTGGQGEVPALDYLRNGRLVLQAECGVEESETVIGDLLVSEIDGGSARIELAGSAPLPFSGRSEVCLAVLFDLDVDSPLGRDLQFTLEKLEDFEMVEGEDEDQYLAGERLRERPALQGDRLRIQDAPPPELVVELPSEVLTVERIGSVDDAEMHVLTLASGAHEGLQVSDLTYRAAEGTSLNGVTDVRLFADRNSNGRLEANEDSFLGTVDVASGHILFSGLGIEIPAAGELDLVVLADLEFFEEPVEEEDGASAFSFPLRGPFSGPWEGSPRVLPLLLLVTAALGLLLVAITLRYQPKPAAALALIALSCLLVGVGCGGGGGGGGGSGKSTLSQSFQLVVASADDIRAQGLQSGTEPVLDAFPPEGVPGSLFVVRKS